ncbi:MAG: glycosyl transferase, partial [Firmicutes bacterium]|nr:glycosyl transferase [Bacillota bacterium]
SGVYAGFPRLYALASELVAHTEARLDREKIVDFLRNYQSVSPLSLAELWAFPLVLRCVLLERLAGLGLGISRRQREQEEADFWANRLLAAARRDPDRTLAVLAELVAAIPEPSPFLAIRLAGHLHDETETSLLLRGWLERKLDLGLHEALEQEQNRQAADQVSIGNAVTSLRFLARLNWKEVFEEVSRVEEILRLDPAGVYGRMDFATRDLYRHAIEELARWSRLDEEEVAREAVAAARRAEGERHRHVGYHLIGKGRREFQGKLGCRVPFPHRLYGYGWIRAHPAAVYFGSLGFFTLGAFAVAAPFLLRREGPIPVRVAALALSFLVASEIGLQLQNRLITRFLPPRPLPRLDLEKGITDEYRTMVVVPMM